MPKNCNKTTIPKRSDSLLNEIVICNDHIHRLLLNKEKALKFINDVWKSTNTVVSLRVIEGILKGESNEE